VRFAFADPPYLGCGSLYAAHHPDARIWDDPQAHADLVARLVREYPDGWAMCLSTPSLRTILPMCPENARVAAWVKPFAVFKPNVNPAYAWEPVIFCGGRRGDRTRDTVRDWFSKEITLKRGLTGAKPEAFCRWVLDLLGYVPGDALDDLFPGTGVMGKVIEGIMSRGHESMPLFCGNTPVESEREPGSVQIYPEAALEAVQ
jgi:hypothetical protein